MLLVVRALWYCMLPRPCAVQVVPRGRHVAEARHPDRGPFVPHNQQVSVDDLGTGHGSVDQTSLVDVKLMRSTVAYGNDSVAEPSDTLATLVRAGLLVDVRELQVDGRH